MRPAHSGEVQSHLLTWLELNLRFFILSVIEQRQVKLLIFKCFELWQIYAKKMNLPVLSRRDNAKCYSQPTIGESNQDTMTAQKGGQGVHMKIFSYVKPPSAFFVKFLAIQGYFFQGHGRICKNLGSWWSVIEESRRKTPDRDQSSFTKSEKRNLKYWSVFYCHLYGQSVLASCPLK